MTPARFSGEQLFSVVIPTLNEGDLLHLTIESILSETEYRNFEVIIVDDGSTDGSTRTYRNPADPRVRLIRTEGKGVARARNLGAGHARGVYVVFLDAHCRVSPNWLSGLEATLDPRDVCIAGPAFTKLEATQPRGCGMSWINYMLDLTWFEPLEVSEPYSVPLTTGACQAFRLATFNSIGRYDNGFSGWGFEDVEICLRAWLLGYRLAVNPTVTVAHNFRESRDYEVDDLEITANFLRMIHMHFSAPRIRRVIHQCDRNPLVGPALDKLYKSDVFDLRKQLLDTRVYDDDWFFREVNPTIDIIAHQ